MPFDDFGWVAPEVTPELAAGIARARAAEEQVQAELRALGEGGRDTLVRLQVIGDASAACEPPLDEARGTDELCAACLEARGPFGGGPARRKLRERARIHLLLSGVTDARSTYVLQSPEDLLALWDKATLREPAVRLRVDEPRWRTASDGVPFTGQFLTPDQEPVSPRLGHETADPADIPALAEVIVDFAHRDDLPPEVVGLGMSYLVFRIHPFADGNGHTSRMLACDIMHRAGYSEPTMLAYIDTLRARHEEVCALSREVALGRATTADHVVSHLDVVLEAQREVLRQLRVMRRASEAVELAGGAG